MLLFLAVPWLVLPLAQNPSGERASYGPPIGDWSWSVQVENESDFKADFEGVAGDLAIYRQGFTLRGRRFYDGDQTFGFGVAYERSSFRFGRGTALGGVVDPIDTGYVATLTANYAKQMTAGWAWNVGVSIGSGVEVGAPFEDGFHYAARAGSTIELSSELDLLVAVLARQRLEDDALVIPVIFVDWRPNDRVHVGRVGEGLGASYAWDEGSTTDLSLAFGQRQFRLDDGSLPAAGVLRDFDVSLNLGHEWSWSEGSTARLVTGVTLRSVALLDDDGREIADERLEPAPFLGFRIGYGF